MHSAHPGQTDRLRDRIAAGRRQRFVGRSSELDAFRTALLTPEPPFAVMHIHGPGGVGKSSLLAELARIGEERDLPVILLDGRNLEASPTGFLIALGMALGLREGESPVEAVARSPGIVLLIDTYEVLAPIDSWLRESFLPQLPARSLTVIAGRLPPDPTWRADPGWQGLIRVLPLRNLEPDESRTYLAARDVPPARHAGILAVTHGHPLALSLLADALAQGDDYAAGLLEDKPDIVRVLLDRFVQQLPGAKHRHALEISAHVRVTTESLLADVIGDADAHELFAWMRGLSFMEQGRDGISPHDLAREVLEADLRWRDPDRYRELHRQVRAPIVRRLQESRGIAQQLAFYDLLYLHRNSPVMKPSHDWGALGQAYAAPAAPEELPGVLEIMARHEGPSSTEIAHHWQERQPGAFLAFRTWNDDLIGFAAHLSLHDTTPDERAADPAATAAWAYAERHGPLRPGEEMICHRFAMGRDTYIEPSPAMDLTAMTSMLQWLSRPKLAWSFLTIPESPAWDQMFTYLNFRRIAEADFTLDDRTYAIYGHDWRVEPVLAWLDMMSERELATEAELAMVRPESPPPPIVLSQPDFAEAVRQALRDYARPAALATSPLMRSRLVRETAGQPSPAAALQAVIGEGADALRSHPKDERLYRALLHTYLQPIGTQEAVAERLDLPFSTYRYHLATAIDRVTETLWHQELHGT